MADTLAARKKVGGRKPKAPPPPPPPPPPPAAAKVGGGSSATVSERILHAVAAGKAGRRGLSLAALKKMLSANGYDVTSNKWRLRQAVRSLVTKGSLVQTSGSGASGSFKLAGKEPREEAARVQKKPRREPPAAPFTITGRDRKPAAARRPAAAKRPKRRVAPRKVRRGAAGGGSRKAAKGGRRAKSPRKGTRRAVPNSRKQRAKPRRAARPPRAQLEEEEEEEKEVESEAPAPEETSASEKTSQACSEIQGST